MKMDERLLVEAVEASGGACYLLDSRQFEDNYRELKAAFSVYYPQINLAYSYKTNYTPKLCRIVNELGGFAEVVSDMELEIALRVGVRPERIIWNGPYKNRKKVEELLLLGGSVNIDAAYELEMVQDIVSKHPEHEFNLGIRCNFEIPDGIISRFGFDINSEEFCETVSFIKNTPNVRFSELQCHFASRRLETWRPRAEGMLALLDKIAIMPDRIDLGGGLFGKMADSLKTQFDSSIPDYAEYAAEVGPLFAQYFANKDYKPTLILEPGSALVGDCMKFIAKIVNIKQVRGKSIATVIGSVYNINPTMNGKNPPLEILKMGDTGEHYKDLDFGGFTCIESDYLYRHYEGRLSVGDYAMFGNVGSYSIVLKPPFILPNFPIVEICDGRIETIKRQEYFDDIFHTFSF